MSGVRSRTSCRQLFKELNRNDLIINIEKTGIMSFHNIQVKFPIKL